MEQNPINTTNTTSLTKATLIAFVVAIVTLLVAILPAEYNIDPTGAGKALGLTVFNAEGAGGKASVLSSSNGDQSGQNDSVLLTVPAGKGIEYKLDMKQYAKASYEWVTDGGQLYVDLHGEPPADNPNYDKGYFESYAIATVDEMQGSFTAPFDGSHGWYWKNTSDKDIQIQLIFNGDYVIEGLK